MARNANIAVSIKGEADFDQARKQLGQDFEKIEKASKDTVNEIEQAFAKADPKLDTTEVRQALALARQLDDITANITVETDLTELEDAERLARSLRSFTGRIDLDVDQRGELREALGLAENLGKLRTVRLEIQGRQDLERAGQLADDLERRRTVPVDARVDDLQSLDDQFRAAGSDAADGFESGFGDVNLDDAAGSMVDQLSGALAAAGPWAAAAAGVAAIFGDEFVDGFNEAWNAHSSDVVRGLRTGLDTADLGDTGRAAGDAYAAGFGEGLAGLKDEAALIEAELGDIDVNLDVTETLRQAKALERVFGVDLATSIATVDKLVSQGLVPNSKAGFDLLFELGQQTGLQFGETLDVTNEFSNALAAIGINGPQGLFLIGKAIESGVFPQIDQAGEVFEEFQEMLSSGDSVAALDAIGLSGEEMQRKLADGRGAEAMAEIAEQLLAIEHPAQRNAAAIAIFGSNMALATDKRFALELFAQADELRSVGDEASIAADKIEATQTSFARLKLTASEAGSSVARVAEQFLGAGGQAAAADQIVRELGGGFDRLKGAIFGADETTARFVDTSVEAREGVSSAGDAAGDAAGSFDDLAISVEDMVTELEGLFDFSADQVLRDIAEAGDDLTRSFADGAAASVGLNGQIDISTQAGRRLQGQMEGLNGILVDAAVAFSNGELTASQFANIQERVTAQLTGTAAQAGLTADRVQGLTSKYNDQAAIGEVVTDLIANDLASPVIRNLQTALAGLHDKTITITTRNAIIAATAATAKARAGGGSTSGLTLLGEQGPELVDFKGQAFVYTATQTRQILAGTGAASPASSSGTGRQAPFIQNATIVIPEGRDTGVELLLAEQLYAAVS